MKTGPLQAYRDRLAAGGLKPDPAQQLAIEKLQSLNHALAGFKPSLGESGWLARFGLVKAKPLNFVWRTGDGVQLVPKQGLYIFGEVGRGKSMLMDLFFENAAIEKKSRVHFHEFMRNIHAEIHRWRTDPATKAGSDPIPRLAHDIAARAWLLCFDELQITDIADAMIVGRLFNCLLDYGVVIVITSNRPPRDLYKDGLQRERFLPFIGLMECYLDLLELNSEGDYRLGRKRGLKVYHAPLDDGAETALELAFSRLTEGATAMPQSFEVNGRKVRVPLAAAGVARFSFAQLCGTALGASDYLTLAERFHTLVLSDIPLLTPARRDEAKRFVTLVDALYEARTTLICSAAAAPEALYPEGTGAFEFKRTVSRLMEMQAEDWMTRERG
ncbi:MAG: cell division protein ZapE [Magnetospirillum sp.]|nr:cell division protein ZapE [Magnetospirillum sp.]